MMVQIKRYEKEMVEFIPSIIPKVSLSFEVQASAIIIDARAYLKLKTDGELREIGCLQLDLSQTPHALIDFLPLDTPGVIKLWTYVSEEIILTLDKLANIGEIELCLDAFFLSHEHGWLKAVDFEGRSPYYFQASSAEWKSAIANMRQMKKESIKKNNSLRELKAKVQINVFEEYAAKGSQGLREKLSSFDINYLKAIIARYSLDHTRKTHKWKTKEKLIEFIVSSVESDIKKGKYFLDFSSKR